MSETEKDHFSGHAACYQQFRPDYPAPLFGYLASLCSAHDLAWDCATGNGQAAVPLARYFTSIVATDFSAQQIEQAERDARVRYLVAPADQAPIEGHSADLVTVAQAPPLVRPHKLLPRGAPGCQAGRVPGGLVLRDAPDHAGDRCDCATPLFRHRGAVLAAGCKIVEEGYRTLPFPFDELAPPRFEMVHSWNLEHVLGYFGSWSSTQRYRKQVGEDPLALIEDDLRAAWGDPERVRDVVWPLNVRVGRVSPVS